MRMHQVERFIGIGSGHEGRSAHRADDEEPRMSEISGGGRSGSIGSQGYLAARWYFALRLASYSARFRFSSAAAARLTSYSARFRFSSAAAAWSSADSDPMELRM